MQLRAAAQSLIHMEGQATRDILLSIKHRDKRHRWQSPKVHRPSVLHIALS